MPKPLWLKTSYRSRRWVDRLSNGRVLAGPFKGMAFESHRGYYVLGAYENEIEDLISAQLDVERTKVVIVGAGEGYYSVGFARYGKAEKVVGFESENEGRSAMRENAERNGVEAKVDIRGSADVPALLNELDAPSGLAIVDVEGYEEELLVGEVVDALRDWTVLIETHGLSPGTGPILRERFAKSHDIQERFSKVRGGRDLQHIGVLARMFVLQQAREHRGGLQSWLYMTPKQLDS